MPGVGDTVDRALPVLLMTHDLLLARGNDNESHWDPRTVCGPAGQGSL